jgi:hypothetical protein
VSVLGNIDQVAGTAIFVTNEALLITSAGLVQVNTQGNQMLGGLTQVDDRSRSGAVVIPPGPPPVTMPGTSEALLLGAPSDLIGGLGGVIVSGGSAGLGSGNEVGGFSSDASSGGGGSDGSISSVGGIAAETGAGAPTTSSSFGDTRESVPTQSAAGDSAAVSGASVPLPGGLWILVQGAVRRFNWRFQAASRR